MPKTPYLKKIVARLFLRSATVVASVSVGHSLRDVGGGRSAISGLGAGLLWTAQGMYFQLSVKLYSHYDGRKAEDVSGLLAGIFTGVYMGFEVYRRADQHDASVFAARAKPRLFDALTSPAAWTWAGLFAGFNEVVVLVASAQAAQNQGLHHLHGDRGMLP